MAPSSASVQRARPSARVPITVTENSKTQATNTTIKLSFTSGNKSQLSASLNTLFHRNLSDAALSPASSSYADLNCNQVYYFTDSDGTFSYQHQCGGSTAPWGYRFSPAIQAIVVGDVHESGMIWELNGTMQGDQTGHDYAATEYFHGTFNPVHDGDYLTYVDYYTFTVEIDGQQGQADETVQGNIHQLGTPPGSPDTGVAAMFNNYSSNATCAEWSGGDATNSVVLPNGERAWFFSDTYLNNAAARKSLWYASVIHNSIIVQNGNSIASTITGGNTCEETNQTLSFWDRYAKTPAAAPDASNGGFYWTGDQMVVGSDVVKFYYHGYPITLPNGGHSFNIDYPAVATIPASSLENGTALTINPTQFSCGATSIIWGSAVLNWQGSVYVYGWQANGTNSDSIYLAKTTSDNLANPGAWQLYDGLSSGNPVWGSCSSSPAALAIDGTTASSVASVNGSLWLIQFDYSYGQLNATGAIGAHPASTPWGFDNNSVALYDPPEGLSVSYPDYYQVYEARIQPGLGPSGDVVISYNVNTLAVDTGCVSANAHDTSIYQPRFVDIPISSFDSSLATPAASTNASAAAVSGTRHSASSSSAALNGPAALHLQAGTVPLAGRPNDWPPTGGIMPPSGAVPARDNASPGPATHTGHSAGTPVTGSVNAAAAGIDGDTDWYEMLPGGTCPAIPAPSAPTPSVAPDGLVTLNWPSVGTDVWYYAYFCDETVDDCSTEGTTSPWTAAWATFQGPLWSPTPSTQIDPVGTTSGGGTDTSGDSFAFYINSFGAGNSSGGGNSPETLQQVTVQPPSAPTGLAATQTTGISGTTYTLSWQQVTYPSSNVYYTVNYCDSTATSCASGASISWTPETPQLDTTATLNFPLGDNLKFCVQASNLGGVSPCSNTAP